MTREEINRLVRDMPVRVPIFCSNCKTKHVVEIWKTDKET